MNNIVCCVFEQPNTRNTFTPRRGVEENWKIWFVS